MPEDFDDVLDRSDLDRQSISEWRTFLKAGAKRTLLEKKGGIDWSEMQSWTDLKRLNGQLEMALLQHANVARLKSPSDGEYCAHDPEGQVNIEVMRGDHVLFTCQAKRVQDLGTKAVTQEEAPSQVWEDRLRSHFRHSTNVFLVDIYAARRWDGLRFFLEKLVTDARQPSDNLQTVHIYSQLQDVPWLRLRVCGVCKAATSRGCHSYEQRSWSVDSKLESAGAFVPRKGLTK